MKAIILIEDDETRIVIDGAAYGPSVTLTNAKVIRAWLNGGGLEDLQSGGTQVNNGESSYEAPKLARVLSDVDRAVDSVHNLLTKGLK